MIKSPDNRPLTWTRIAWTAFGLALVAALALIVLSPRLAAFGLTSSMYYIVLIPVGLAAAGFLFGALRSRAKYEGTLFGGTLQLGGPVVVFVGVVGGGFLLARPESSIPLIVRVYGPGGQADILRTGTVSVDLETDRRQATLNDRGEVYFNEIPVRFAGKSVTFAADVPGYTIKDPSARPIPGSHVVYLEMTARPVPVPKRKIGGLVESAPAHGLAGVRVVLPSLSVSTVTNADGRFDFAVATQESEILLRTEKSGYDNYEQYVSVGNDDIALTLKKSHRAGP
jgi:hypothetical protein